MHIPDPVRLERLLIELGQNEDIQVYCTIDKGYPDRSSLCGS